ncbi:MULTISPECIES: PaaI family thioesterase [Nocardia]|uniref:PaaI family thioesterase n=1 Tax=Nocardia TaxID=1817 RepID=UPI001E3A078B|nr:MULTISPECIES: PaaI family thioesterase [Nocardia]
MSDPANRNGIASTDSVATSTQGVQLLVSETNSFMSDFGLVSVQLDRTRSLLRCDLTDKLRSHAGTAPVGLQATVMDFVTSDPALVAAAPDWTATQDLSLHGAGWVTVGPIVVDSTLVRVGKKVVVVAADVYDGNGCEDLHELAAAIDAADPRSRPTLAARGLVTFARLPRAAAHGADEYTPDRWIGQIRSRPMVPIEDALYPRLGIRVIDAARGELELDRTPFVANQIGTIMGGVQALLAEYAANAMRPELVASDIQMNFLAQVRVGPARTYGTVIRDDADHSVVSVRLVDAGADEMILALATVTLRKPPAHH